MSGPLAYWHCGGELIARSGQVLGPADVAALADLYLDEARAAARVGDGRAEQAARRLERQLSEAASAAARWRRAGCGAVALQGRAT